MKHDDLIFFRQWFADYCKSFYTDDPEDQKNILLKEDHTINVCENMVRITGDLLLDEERTLLAETIALFHDVGRFPQYARFKTFRDSDSVNHGVLGSATLIEKRILQSLARDDQDIILESVRFHNAFSIPKNENEDIIFFIRLIRDADKLDIWRVFLEYYESPDGSKASAVGLGLPDVPEYTDGILSVIYDKQIIRLVDLKTLNDFKLLQLSWVFDLNFRPSFQILKERDYINRIAAHLPQTEEINKVIVFLKEYVQEKLLVK
ncbi:MAG: HD domain-containing protein [Thermodesulfovibrionales bacterium]|nr:HD domain-containing protein [Thermodesulfovibrionales bacterium]